MASKLPTTQKQIIVLNATPLDDDEADYLVSRERLRTDKGSSFKTFLKRHPGEVEFFEKRQGKQPGAKWKSQLLSGTEKEFTGLAAPVRAAAMAALHDLAQDPFPAGSAKVGGHRGYYRAPFYRDEYRIIYKVSKAQREVVVLRIRRKDEKTYVGHEKSGELQ